MYLKLLKLLQGDAYRYSSWLGYFSSLRNFSVLLGTQPKITLNSEQLARKLHPDKTHKSKLP